MRKSPCKDCEDRDLTCHDDCPKFKRYRAKIDKANKARRAETEISTYTYNSIHKYKKNRNLGWWDK